MKRIKLDKIPFITMNQFHRPPHSVRGLFSEVTSFLREIPINRTLGMPDVMMFRLLYDETYCDHKDLTLTKI